MERREAVMQDNAERERQAVDWIQTRRRILTRWPAITDDELDATGGEVSALLGLLQNKLGYAEANARLDLQEILHGALVVPQDVADDPASEHGSDALPTSHTPPPTPQDPLSTPGEIVA
jgi:hypothetical protein